MCKDSKISFEDQGRSTFLIEMVFWSQIVLVCALIIFACPKGLETLPSQHLCGSHLVDALYFVCGPKGFYYLPKAKRGQEEFLELRGGEESTQENEIEQQFPFHKLLGRMIKRGIVEHCCHSTCSLFDLEGYCNQ
ncbi:insulin-like isoform X1 [Leucoraja erinacea]|uniref:insulin-like isoform X1 n=2 Tax=Leucoraja erinaceus TaxID=7782 RepID=UPI0024570223|nr:insulin-like isoform X1 [Leucoraja erinacea]